MVSFYKLRYTNFISSDNYLVGLNHEINPESRFLALGTRKNYVVADLNYSCFLARRASLFLFGSLVRRSHPAVSFGYQFYDYEGIFSEFSTLSVSYVRDWVPGLLTNYRALFGTALKEEGALQRIGFFFQFPDILLMFGANNSIGFIINEARSIQIPTIITGDTSLSFSQVSYMLLGNYRSFKSTRFFVKLFLDLNSESRRFRTLKHYSVFKGLIKSIFLRRTLKSKLFSIKLARMFFIFKAFPKLRVSQVTPTVYKKDNWLPVSFFRVLGGSNFKKKSTMRKSTEDCVKQLSPVSKREYGANRRVLLHLPQITVKFRHKRLVLNKKIAPLLGKRAPVYNFGLRSKSKVLEQRINKIRLLKKTGGFTDKGVRLINTNKFLKLLKIAKKRGLRTRLLLKRANRFVFRRLKKLNSPESDYSATNFLPVFIPDRQTLRQLFPFFGYFAHGHMFKRLNTLLFYRTIFRKIMQKRKKVLRFKSFASNLRFISVEAKKFRSLSLAVHRKTASIFKLRAKVKRFSKMLRFIPKLDKLRKIPGFNEKLYIRRLLRGKKRKLIKRKSFGKPQKDNNRGKKVHNRHPKSNLPTKFGRKGEERVKNKKKHYNRPPKNSKAPYLKKSAIDRSREARENFVALMDKLYKQETRDRGPRPANKPKWLEDLNKTGMGKRAILKKKPEFELKKKQFNKIVSKKKSGRLKLVNAPSFVKRRALVVKNFTPTQRHILRVYRILLTKYPSFIKRVRVGLSARSRVTTMPRTLYQFSLKKRKYLADRIFKRTGKKVRFRPIELPRQFRSSGRGKGKKPWHKDFSNPKKDYAKNSNGGGKKDWRMSKPYHYTKQGSADYNRGRDKKWTKKGKPTNHGKSAVVVDNKVLSDKSEYYKPKASKKKDKKDNSSHGKDKK